MSNYYFENACKIDTITLNKQVVKVMRYKKYFLHFMAKYYNSIIRLINHFKV